MAPTKVGEGSGSRTRSGRWLRRSRCRAGQSERPASSQGRRPGSKAAGTSRAADDSGRMTRNTRASASAFASAASKKRSRAGKETVPRRSKRGDMGDAEEEAAASVSASTEQASSSQVSSAVSSPVRAPYMPRRVLEVDEGGREIFDPYTNTDDEEIEGVYLKLRTKYFEKCRNQGKLVTLDEKVPPTRLTLPRSASSRESITEMVLKVARVVFGLSSSIDGKLLKRASGFLIDWDKESKIGTILTSAFLIRSMSTSIDEWSGTDEYAPNAEVRVHLLDRDDTNKIAELVHYDKQYNFAVFKFEINLDTQIPLFSEPKFGQDIIVIGRDENMHLIVDHGIVPHMDPGCYHRNQYMLTGSKANKCVPGGPVVDLNGQFLGMVNLPSMAFTPSAIIHKCLHMLKKFHCIPRLQTGMKFDSIRFLGLVHREKIIRKCGIDKGLIVTEVSEGSAAEKVGIRTGDIVESWNGESLSTTVELESLLLRMTEEYLDNGGCIGSNVDVPVGIYQVRKDSHRRKILTVKVGHEGEVIAEGRYAVTAAHCALVSNDDVNLGQEADIETC